MHQPAAGLAGSELAGVTAPIARASVSAPFGLSRAGDGFRLQVWSAHANAMELRVFSATDPDWLEDRIPMHLASDGVWAVESDALQFGTPYAIGVDGPSGTQHAFDVRKHAIPPYARGLRRTRRGDYRATVVDPHFDWGDSKRPHTPLNRSVLYETHIRGMTKLNTAMPEVLRGTYAGLAHPSTIDYLQRLGVTAVELLPVHQFLSEQRLLSQGRSNYWGYNTLGFFAPHALYASRGAQFDGTGGVLREFKGMVKLLHEAGIEVLLDVVYNHTAEEGRLGPARSLRLIDNASYYRQNADGEYIDVTGCGNSLNTSLPAVQDLIVDSLRYWVDEVQIDGFRFDLAATLGRDSEHHYDREHPLLHRITSDPVISSAKLIAEPWDVGLGGWQLGNFPNGWSEWNDAYRDRSRSFWLEDYRAARDHGDAAHGVGSIADNLSGSAGVFRAQRGPLASINFVTAHDGFTLADLVAYDHKHNAGNGEQNRDGSDHNRSYNHGVEGRTDDPQILYDRLRSMRNLLGTLLTSAGVPMLTAGDEFGRTQRGNNNAYCQDSALTWLPWQRSTWQEALLAQTRQLVQLRREHAALRPFEFGEDGVHLEGSSTMRRFNAAGVAMSADDWNNRGERTVQYLVASTPAEEGYSRVLVVIHGSPTDREVTLASGDGIEAYELLWDSADTRHNVETHLPAETVSVEGMSMRIYRALGMPESGIPEATAVRFRPRTASVPIDGPEHGGPLAPG